MLVSKSASIPSPPTPVACDPGLLTSVADLSLNSGNLSTSEVEDTEFPKRWNGSVKGKEGSCYLNGFDRSPSPSPPPSHQLVGTSTQSNGSRRASNGVETSNWSLPGFSTVWDDDAEDLRGRDGVRASFGAATESDAATSHTFSIPPSSPFQTPSSPSSSSSASAPAPYTSTYNPASSPRFIFASSPTSPSPSTPISTSTQVSPSRSRGRRAHHEVFHCVHGGCTKSFTRRSSLETHHRFMHSASTS